MEMWWKRNKKWSEWPPTYRIDVRNVIDKVAFAQVNGDFSVRWAFFEHAGSLAAWAVLVVFGIGRVDRRTVWRLAARCGVVRRRMIGGGGQDGWHIGARCCAGVERCVVLCMLLRVRGLIGLRENTYVISHLTKIVERESVLCWMERIQRMMEWIVMCEIWILVQIFMIWV